MFQFRLIWLLVLTALAAILFAFLSQYVFAPQRPESLFPTIDGSSAKAEYIDLGPNDRLFIRYRCFSDSGVELERVVDDRTHWMVYCPPLGAIHSHYKHDVHVEINDGQIIVYSQGSYGNFQEIRDITNGKLIKRTQEE